jgi:short-subunit dehydrogenase
MYKQDRADAPGGIYCATKAAVSSFNGSLLRELVNTDIRVCEIQPGMVETEFSIVRFRGDKQAADDVYSGLTPCMLFSLVGVCCGDSGQKRYEHVRKRKREINEGGWKHS